MQYYFFSLGLVFSCIFYGMEKNTEEDSSCVRSTIRFTLGCAKKLLPAVINANCLAMRAADCLYDYQHGIESPMCKYAINAGSWIIENPSCAVTSCVVCVGGGICAYQCLCRNGGEKITKKKRKVKQADRFKMD